MIALLFSVLQQLQINNPTTFLLLLLIPITNLLLLILQLTRNPTILTYSLIPRKNLALSLQFLETIFFRNNRRRSQRFHFQSSYHSWLISKQRSSLFSFVDNPPPSTPTTPNPTTDTKPSNSNHRRILRKLRKHRKNSSIPKKLRVSISLDVKLSPDLQRKLEPCLLSCLTKLTNILITHHEQSL